MKKGKPHSQKPFEGTYWLKPGRLLAGECPSGSSAQLTMARLTAMLDCGIRTFINLRDDIEFQNNPMSNYEEILGKTANEKSVEINYFHFAIPDMNIPSKESMINILDTIDEMITKAGPVYFHCWAGLGRTGTVAGCWLARHNRKQGREILAKLDQIRSNQNHKTFYDSPQSKEQQEMVISWQWAQ